MGVKYMVWVFGNRDTWAADMAAWTPEHLGSMVSHMEALNTELTESGELLDAQGLAGPEQARTVRAQSAGPAAVTEGPQPENAKVIAGYWLVDVATEQRALEIAARASACPGPDGTPSNEPVEVHLVMEAPPA